LVLPLTGSNIRVKLDLEQRPKGLLWFTTYGVEFDAKYEVKNDTALPRTITVFFPLETENTVYDGFRITEPSGAPRPISVIADGARFDATLAPGKSLAFGVHYEARGRTTWRYALTRDTARVDQFRMSVATDFANVHFPAGTLSPPNHGPSGNGWQGDWRLFYLEASTSVGIELPQKLNPGPLASRITFFAPVGLLFFMFVASVLGAAKKMRLHPMH